MTKAKRLGSDAPKDGVPIKVVKAEENWSVITLENGTVLRIKPVIMDVLKLHSNTSGEDHYGIKSTLVIDIQQEKAKTQK